MTKYQALQIYRLNRSVERLKEYYILNAPNILKQTELLLIGEICGNLSVKLEGNN